MSKTIAKSCRNKHKHPSFGKAEAHKRSIVKRFSEDPAALDSYWCQYCGFWHVGHKKLSAIKNKSS